MMSSTSLTFITFAVLAVSPVIPGAFCINHDHLQVGYEVHREDIVNPVDGNEEQPGHDSCKWESSPENGFNFRPCSMGLCWDKEGSPKRNGTLRFTKCDPHFVLIGGSERTSCLNGQWTSGGQQCIPCGRSQNSVNPLAQVHGGEVSSRGDIPWMAAVYCRSKNTDKWLHTCGGTLLSPNLVLSAAHCFFRGDLALKIENVTVGLGKLNSSFYHQADASSIIFSVKEIVRPDRYVGVEHYFDMDIALLVLSSSVVTGPNIMPACVDWDAAMEPKHNEVGYFGGWDARGDNKSEALKLETQRYVQYNKCLAMVNRLNRRLVTHDKICTEKANDTTEDHGKSGGGLTFLRHGTHFVYGVMSTRSFSDSSNIRFLTYVLDDGHLVWLRRQWKRMFLNEGSPRLSPAQTSITINVTDTVIIETGKNITLSCTGRSIVSSKPVELEWIKENGELPKERAQDDRLGVLSIKDVQISDSGHYICTASDSFTFVSKQALLTVVGGQL